VASDADHETIRRLYEAWNSPGGMQESLDLFDPEVEYVNPDSAIEPGIRRGHAGMLEVLDSIDGSFDEYVHELQRVVDAGDKILTYVVFRARGRDSGALVEKPEQQVFTMRDGKIVRFEWFHDERTARKAAGL
jgi:ketosteroid isomerase-like protein